MQLIRYSIGPSLRRRKFDSPVRRGIFSADSLTVSVQPHVQLHAFMPVSYTHLTLPTTILV